MIHEHTEGMQIETGFITGMPESAYHLHPAISKSGLDKVNKSPAHYKDAPEWTPTPAMMLGTAIHTAILEPDRFEAEYIVTEAKDRRQKAYKDDVAEHGVERVLLPHDYQHVRNMQKALHDHPSVGPMVRMDGHREVSAFARDPETGVQVRCRYDLLGDRTAVDLKKSRDVLPFGFGRSVASYRYHVQVAFYSDLHEWITGEKLREFWLLAIEESFPYTPVPYLLDDMVIEAGRLAYRRDLNTYARCLESGEWPKFEPESPYLPVPGWVTAELEDALEVA